MTSINVTYKDGTTDEFTSNKFVFANDDDDNWFTINENVNDNDSDDYDEDEDVLVAEINRSEIRKIHYGQ